jgi:hypothetical protein
LDEKISSRSKLNIDHRSIIRFALKKAVRLVHHSLIEYSIVPSMREELDFFEESLASNSGVELEFTIAYLIKKTPFATAYGVACLDSAGGYSFGLKFVWWLKFTDAVVKCTLNTSRTTETIISYQSMY